MNSGAAGHWIVLGPGKGWHVANVTLKHERGMLGDPNQAHIAATGG